MTDKTRDEVSRYDELSPRARWFLQNFDEIDLADICANNEAAAAKAQATVERVRAAADQIHRAALNADGEPLTAYDRGVDTAVRRIVAALDGKEQS